VSLYNATLNAALDALGGNVIRVNAFALFDEIMADPARYGFANWTSPACTSVVAGRVYAPFCTPQTLATPEAPETYVFAEGSHPTTATHRPTTWWP
jgi:outer membrane lipase/esterase